MGDWHDLWLWRASLLQSEQHSWQRDLLVIGRGRQSRQRARNRCNTLDAASNRQHHQSGTLDIGQNHWTLRDWRYFGRNLNTNRNLYPQLTLVGNAQIPP